MTHDDEKFNDYLQRLARDLDPTPEVPREELWARIDAARRPVQDAPGHPDVVPLASRRPAARRYLQWAAALAAVLVLGIAIGRMTQLQQAGSGAGAPVASSEAAPGATDTAPLPYRLAAVQHLQRTEALLATLSTDARSGQVGEVAHWAGDLLTDTRLLLDSPAGQDAELHKLLEDLELVLAQIAMLQAQDAAGEVEMIEDGMNQRDVLLRLRAATARRELAGS